MLPRWGVCTTVRARSEEVLAFVAHHLDLGASRIWVHLDAPDDPDAAVVERVLAGHPLVTVVRCTAAYWQKSVGRHPPTIELRQMRNATRTYRKTELPFLCHLDVDEFLLAERPVAELLAELPEDRTVLRAEPFEALHDPSLADDIFTARLFRRQMRSPDPVLLGRLYGRLGDLLDKGMLSHTVGKAFFRTGIEGMTIHIHGAKIAGERVFGGRFSPDLALLHFHAEDPGRWRSSLGFRLERGAYRFLPALQAHLAGSDTGALDTFYELVQTARPELVRGLRSAGLLREADLRLRAKVKAAFGTTP